MAEPSAQSHGSSHSLHWHRDKGIDLSPIAQLTVVIATPTSNQPRVAQRACMEESGRHLCGRVKVCDRHGHDRLVACSIAELTVLIASPTTNGSICQTRTGKIQPHGNLPS